MRKSKFENKNLNGTLPSIHNLTKFHGNIQWFHKADKIKSWKKPTKIKYHSYARLIQESNSIPKIKKSKKIADITATAKETMKSFNESPMRNRQGKSFLTNAK